MRKEIQMDGRQKTENLTNVFLKKPCGIALYYLCPSHNKHNTCQEVAVLVE